MIGCTVQQLCNAVGGTLLQESGAVVTEVSTDSRSIPAGALFVPLVGERFDDTTIWTRRWQAARLAV